MKIYTLPLLLIAALCDSPAGIVDITQQNKSQLQSGLWFVKYYTHWCHFSQALAPEFESLQQHKQQVLQCSPQQVQLGAVDCQAEPAMCQEMQIKGYPTLVVFQNGKRVMDYTGERKEYQMAQFLNQFLKQQPQQ